ncbi:MAG: hypothetical protein ABEI78_02270, partial [Candidatus Nanohaloarchaea archaeon]
MENETKFHEFLYKIENTLDEFVIAILSFGAIFVTLNTMISGAGLSWVTLGRTIQPWITMLALMIIGRELWILNHKLQTYFEK